MTDTDSASLQFTVIADKTWDLGERELRNDLLKTFLNNYIHKRLKLSSDYFEQFNKHNVSIRKQIGLYKFENIEHGIICGICINPKEYFELYCIFYEKNKKHKGVRKRMKGMGFDNYASRILLIDGTREGTNRFSHKIYRPGFKIKREIWSWLQQSKFGQLSTPMVYIRFLTDIETFVLLRNLKIIWSYLPKI